MASEPTNLEFDYAKYGFRQEENYLFKAPVGLSEKVVRELSGMKNEPEWMLKRRLKALEIFYKKPTPLVGMWANHELAELDYDKIHYFVRAGEKPQSDWDAVPIEIKNTFERLGIPEAERKFLAGVGAQYECLSGDARVYTNKGLVPIQDIQPGDTVFSFDEETNRIIPAEVRATAHKGEREVFEVRVGTRRIKATSNHPFLALTYQKDEDRVRGRYARSWKYLHELAPGDLVAVAKDLPDTGVLHVLQQPEIKTVVVGRNQSTSYDLNIAGRYNQVKLPEYTTEDLMWWLGLYIGDGFIHSQHDADKARVEIAIPASDSELRAVLIKVTEELFDHTPTSSDPYRVTLNSTIVARFLEANDFAGKALTKRVPSWVFGLPQTQKLAFLGGYLDSDGYVRDTEKNHDIMLTSGNRDLLQDMTELLSLCGLPTSTIHRFESKHPVDAERMITGYRVQVAGDYERIGSRSPNRLGRMSKRKYHHDFSSAKGTTFRTHVTEFHGYVKIDSITPAGVEVVYDIEVDGPHNFVAEGLIVHNSEVVYHSLREEWSKLGVIFLDTDSALREYPEMFKEYFGTIIPAADNKYAALNTAVWSGGSFVYVPAGVKVDIPLQAYFRINAENMGQFERTLIIIEEGAEAHYIEGCFLAGARVVTEAGEKPIEQIEVGDKVLTHHGRYRRVYNTMRRPYTGDTYTIRYWGDSTQALQVTADHPLLVVKRQRMHERNDSLTLSWMPASDVREGDYLAIPIAHPEAEPVSTPSVTIPYRPQGQRTSLEREVSFPQEPDFYRLLGYYFAEGHVSNEHYLTFSFHAQEVEYLQDTTQLLSHYFGKEPIANKERQNGQTLVLCSTEAARAFAYEFGSTAYDKHVPAWISNAPRYLLAEFVRGLWCSDGSYDATKNMFRYNSVSRNLAYAFRNALLRLGIAASVNCQEREAPRQPMYVVVVSSPFNPQFGDLVGVAAPAGSMNGSPFCLDEHYLYVPIRSIECGESEADVYNFSVEEDESYVGEGVVSHNCTAPIYSTNSLHSAVVEIVIKKGGKFRYTTIQNWANNIFNLVTKRAVAHEEASMEWVDGNIGSKLTMKYPSVYLMGRKARGEVLSIAYAGKGQHQDAGAKMVHIAPETTSRITNKSVSKNGGKTTYRGLAKVAPGAYGAKVNVNCDALILDERSASDTIPFIEIEEDRCTLAHEATVGRIGAEQLFYLMSRGLKEADALSMIVLGFMEPFTRELPMEYAVELNRLIQMEMEGSVG